VSLLLLVLLVAAGYLTVVWLPIYVDHFSAKQVTRDFMNRAVKNRNDSQLVIGLSSSLARIGKQQVVDEQGTEWEVPLVDVPPEAITWERDTSAVPPVVRVGFEYERTVRYPIIDRTAVAHFTIEMERDLTVPVWE